MESHWREQDADPGPVPQFNDMDDMDSRRNEHQKAPFFIRYLFVDFSTISKSFKILHLFIFILNFFKIKYFSCSYFHFLETLKANEPETAKKTTKKRVFFDMAKS
jgi:hypothetical protein